MKQLDVSTWSRHELRLAFFDFSVRGEGGPELVDGVLRAWLALGGLSRQQFDYWRDALAWRERGNALPGWALPQIEAGSPNPPCAGEEHEREFLRWRSARQAA
jgi:hypothetical protein